MMSIYSVQANNIFTQSKKLDNHQNNVLMATYSTAHDAIVRESIDQPIYHSPISNGTINRCQRINVSLNHIENSPAALSKNEPFYVNGTFSGSNIQTSVADIDRKQPTRIISVPFQITENLVCYAPVTANYVKDISSTNLTLLYATSKSNRGLLVVKDFGADAVIHPSDRLYQQIDASMEVFISQLGKKLQVNVPKSWISPNTEIKNTTVISEYIKHKPTLYPHLHRGFDALENNHSFITTYRNSKLPIFHYLINHPHVKIDSTTYANIIIDDNCELFSIDHEGCLKKGRLTPYFTAEQINQFFPDKDSYENFKKMNVAEEVSSAFGSVLKEHGKTISEIKELNVADFEFRKNHLLRQYEKYHAL